MNRGFPSIDADSSSSRFPTFFTFPSLFSCKFRIHEGLMEESRNATSIFYFERMHMNRILKWKRLKGFFLSFAQYLEIFFFAREWGKCGLRNTEIRRKRRKIPPIRTGRNKSISSSRVKSVSHFPHPLLFRNVERRRGMHIFFVCSPSVKGTCATSKTRTRHEPHSSILQMHARCILR